MSNASKASRRTADRRPPTADRRQNVTWLRQVWGFEASSATLFALSAALGVLFQVPGARAAQEPAFTAITNSPISEAWMFSAAWGDYDRDGFIDLLAVDWYENNPGQGRIYLFRNKGDGSFVKSTLNRSAYSHSGFIIGAIWGDYDNDGRPDISVTGSGLWIGPNPHIVLHHEADGTFSRSATPRFPSGFSQSNIWGDFDNDGWLDAFAGYWTDSFSTGNVSDRLYRNNGDGTFTETREARINRLNNNDDAAMSAATGDFNGDGLMDILVGTVSPRQSRLFINKGALVFDRVLVTPSAPDRFGDYALGIAVADYDNDGDLDFLTVSKSGGTGWTCACDGPLAGWTRLWRNDGTGNFEQVVAGDLGNEDTIGANGAAWADYNNDGWVDVALFRGIYSNGRGQDAADLLYRNNGDGTFTRVTTGPIVNEDGDARAGAWGDIDNDGDMDLVVANYNWFAPAGSNRYPVLYRNEGNENHWLKLSLAGTVGNRDAIGAKVRVKATIKGKELWQLQEIRSNTGWIASQNDMRPHFGLGNATMADVVRVEWPSGVVSEFFNVPADKIMSIVEPPALSIAPAVVLSWPAHAEGYVLFGADAVAGPWTRLAAEVQVKDGKATVTVKSDERMSFYQLRQP